MYKFIYFCVYSLYRADIFLIQWHVYVKTRSMDNEFHLSTIENFRTLEMGETDRSICNNFKKIKEMKLALNWY